MRVQQRLQKYMWETNLNPVEVGAMTGFSPVLINEYLEGRQTPNSAQRRKLAKGLGLPEAFFLEMDPERKLPSNQLSAKTAAKLMGKPIAWLEKGLQDGVFPWGYAVKGKGPGSKYSYWISRFKFEECTGIDTTEEEK